MADKSSKKDISAENLTAKELYDIVMMQIEPDLTSTMLPMLDDIYGEENKEDRKNRLTWYARAFEICSQRLALIVDLWKAELTDIKDEIVSEAKEAASVEEEKHLEDIEHNLGSA